MADRTGQQLGNYRLARLLGRGGFAEVYLGEHLRLNTHTAIKVLQTQLASDDDIESFQKEAQTIANLKHPSIVRVLDFDVEDNTPFLVMEYAPNGSLRKRHPRGVPLLLPTVISYVKQVADALQSKPPSGKSATFFIGVNIKVKLKASKYDSTSQILFFSPNEERSTSQSSACPTASGLGARAS